MFKTELHCHSTDISRCASATVSDIIDTYTEAGYSSLVLANHFKTGTMQEQGCRSYAEFVERYVWGYEKLKRAAEGRLNILFGVELRFNENRNDYLLFGATPEFLLGREDMFEMTPASFSSYARECGVLFVQAHPFRNEMEIVNPKYLDGVEVFNGNVGHDSFRNELTEAWADRYSLIRTSGSDYHHKKNFADGGISTGSEIKTMDELVSVLRSGEYELICDKSRFPNDG